MRAEKSFDDLFDSDDEPASKAVSSAVGKAQAVAESAPTAASKAVSGAVVKAQAVAQSASDPLKAYSEQLVSFLKAKVPALEPTLSQADPTQVLFLSAAVALAGLAAIVSSLGSADEAPSSGEAPAAGADAAAERTTAAAAEEPAAAAPATAAVTTEGALPAEVAVAEAPQQQAAKPAAEPTVDSSVAAGAVLFALAAGYVGGWLLAAVVFVAASWYGKRRNDDAATVLRGVGGNAIKVVDFGDYLNGKYNPVSKLGDSVSSAVSGVEGKDDTVDGVIGAARKATGSVAGAAQTFDRDFGFKSSAGTIATKAADLGILAGDVVAEKIVGPILQDKPGPDTEHKSP